MLKAISAAFIYFICKIVFNRIRKNMVIMKFFCLELPPGHLIEIPPADKLLLAKNKELF